MPETISKPATPRERPSAEAAALMTIARGQKALHRLAMRWLKADKYDGAKFVALMQKHGEVFRAVKDDLRDLALIEEHQIREANELAGEPEGVD
jgi:hypothetical protein